MTAEVHVRDVGTVLTITLKDGTDPVPLGDATEIKMRLSDPDEITVVKTLEVQTPPGADGKVIYTFIVGDLAKEGPYTYQVKVTFPLGYWQSDILTFTVYENIEESSASASASASPSPSS